ncbi:MAG TPA: cupin domain-containing protein [Myxococcota bacterium]|nr:cupin domain-containing protein [Myxococcota bacterium]
MKTPALRTRHSVGLALLALLTAVALGSARGDAKKEEAAVVPLFNGALTDLPGQDLTAVMVTYPPGGKSEPHKHPGSVFAYVLSGAVRSQSSLTGPVRVYKAGESFFEPAGGEHLVSENASATEPARFLAVFVAPSGAKLTEYTAH